MRLSASWLIVISFLFEVLFVYEVCIFSIFILFEVLNPLNGQPTHFILLYSLLVEGNEMLHLFEGHGLSDELYLDLLALFEHALGAC